MRFRRLLPPSFLYAAIVLMAVLHFALPVAAVIGYPWNLLGVAPLALGIALNLVADTAFKRHGTTVKPFEESTALITTGVFRISRHPMYLGMVLMLLGLAVLLGSATPFLVVVAFPFLMELVFVRTEERMLEETFGPAWLAYRHRVRRWI